MPAKDKGSTKSRNSKKKPASAGPAKPKDEKSVTSKSSITASAKSKQSNASKPPETKPQKDSKKTKAPGGGGTVEDSSKADDDKEHGSTISSSRSSVSAQTKQTPQPVFKSERGNDDEDYFGMYRRVADSGMGRLDPVHKAFAKFYPWRPKGNVFLSSGYYLDMDRGAGGSGLKPNEIMIHNIPSNINEAALRKEFPGASKVELDSDGTARLQFKTGPEAEKAYRDSKWVKVGNRHLAFINPHEVYLVGASSDMTESDIKRDYPNSTGSYFIDSPGARRTAVITFKSKGDADQDFEKSPYKKIGDHQNSNELDENPLRVTNIRPNVTEDDIRKKFPGAKDVIIDKGSGTALVRFAGNEEARKAYNSSDSAHLGKPKLAWVNPDELAIEGIPNGVNESTLKKDFPNAKSVRLVEGEGGKHVAIIQFSSPDEQKKAFSGSRHTKIGPQRLGFAAGGKGGSNKVDKHAQLKIQSIPPGVTADKLKKMFPNANDAVLDGKGGATLQFDTPDDAARAYEDADMAKLKNNTLAYLAPNQLAVEGLGKKLKEAMIKKDFPTEKNVKILNGDKGYVAIIDFASEDDQKKAYEHSHYTKVGPQRLGFDGIVGGDPETQLKIQNLPSGFTENDLEKKFPNALAITMEKGGKATVHFDTPADASKSYNNSDMARMGDNNLGFLGPNQIAVTGLPTKKDKIVKKQFPRAKKIHWLDGPNKTHVAILDYPDAGTMKNDFDKSSFEKTGPQTVDGGEEELDDMEMAKKLWKLKGADFSNLSNLFSAAIRLTNVPLTTKALDLIKIFDDCKKCEFQGVGAKRVAILEFDKPTSAAKAYGKAKKLKIDGNEIQVKVVPIGGGKGKKGKSPGGSAPSAKSKKKK